ncbi:MAG: DUF1638 domain-containing protein [Clostridiales bacterium]|nr:DUF1638 domain-containing protein [Clostridiales bacterium]
MGSVLKMIGCEILYREMCLCASRSKNVIDLEFMPKGLHDMGEEKMSALLQEKIDAADPERFDAVLLCYGLCNYGTKGLHASIPLVLPRAHDCITLLMGSKEKYSEYFFGNPGTMFMSSGWLERNADQQGREGSIPAKLGMRIDYEKYDDDDAEYLRSILGSWLKNYSKYAFIDNGTGAADTYEERVKRIAGDRGWKYEKVAGDTGLIQRLMDGDWDSADFQYVPADYRVTVTYGDDIVSCEPVPHGD